VRRSKKKEQESKAAVGEVDEVGRVDGVVGEVVGGEAEVVVAAQV